MHLRAKTCRISTATGQATVSNHSLPPSESPSLRCMELMEFYGYTTMLGNLISSWDQVKVGFLILPWHPRMPCGPYGPWSRGSFEAPDQWRRLICSSCKKSRISAALMAPGRSCLLAKISSVAPGVWKLTILWAKSPYVYVFFGEIVLDRWLRMEWENAKRMLSTGGFASWTLGTPCVLGCHVHRELGWFDCTQRWYLHAMLFLKGALDLFPLTSTCQNVLPEEVFPQQRNLANDDDPIQVGSYFDGVGSNSKHVYPLVD